MWVETHILSCLFSMLILMNEQDVTLFDMHSGSVTGPYIMLLWALLLHRCKCSQESELQYTVVNLDIKQLILLIQFYAIFGTYAVCINISFKDTGVESENFNVMPDAAY